MCYTNRVMLCTWNELSKIIQKKKKNRTLHQSTDQDKDKSLDNIVELN